MVIKTDWEYLFKTQKFVNYYANYFEEIISFLLICGRNSQFLESRKVNLYPKMCLVGAILKVAPLSSDGGTITV